MSEKVFEYHTFGDKPAGLGGELRPRFELASPYGPDADESGPDTEYAANVLHVVRAGWNEMHVGQPDLYVGMAALGSAVKGRIHKGSDVDGVIFYNPDSAFAQSVIQGQLVDRINGDINDNILCALAAAGYGESFSGLGSFQKMALNSGIIDNGIALAEMRLNREGVGSRLNKLDLAITAMFFMRVGNGTLQDHRKHLLDRLSVSPFGEEIWSNITGFIAEEEEFRRQATIFLPRSIKEAYGYFNVAGTDAVPAAAPYEVGIAA
jgi:hypothetical protein